MARARQALQEHDPARSLSLLDDYAAKFPQGVLREEQLATRVLALCALGRDAAAKKVREELERMAPHSPQLGRLRISCAADGSARP
jgi:hypothetical protein